MQNLDPREKTASEIYHAVIALGMLPSVQKSIAGYLDIFTIKKKETSLKKIKKILKISYLTAFPPLGFLSLYQIQKTDPVDIIFSFFGTSKSWKGIQSRLAKQCLLNNLRPEIIHRLQHKHYSEFASTFLTLGGLPVPKKIRREIVRQSEEVVAKLNSLLIRDFNKRQAYSILCSYATQIEQEAIWIEKLLATKKPKLTIMARASFLQDAAVEIACSQTSTPSILVPHGWPQRLNYPITSSFVKSFCYHHDQYLKTLCLKPNQVLGMGWLEPSVTLGLNLINMKNEKESSKKTEKQHILFFSQMHGKFLHRCDSLIDYIPHIFKALDKMDAVETITLRLHPWEDKNPDNKEFISQLNCSKLRLSTGKPIAEDLQASTMLMAFSSTALMYGPYLNMKAVEIRDEAINAEWGGTVLPPEQVYQIKGEFNPDEFCDFVANVPTLKGEDVFYNYGRELEAFGDFLETLI